MQSHKERMLLAVLLALTSFAVAEEGDGASGSGDTGLCVDDPMGYVAADSSKSCDMVDAQGGWWACESLDPDFNGVKNIYVWELCPKSCKKCPTGAMSTFFISLRLSRFESTQGSYSCTPRETHFASAPACQDRTFVMCVCAHMCVFILVLQVLFVFLCPAFT